MSVLDRIKALRHERTGLDYSGLSLELTGHVWTDIESAMKQVHEYECSLGYEPALKG